MREIFRQLLRRREDSTIQIQIIKLKKFRGFGDARGKRGKRRSWPRNLLRTVKWRIKDFDDQNVRIKRKETNEIKRAASKGEHLPRKWGSMLAKRKEKKKRLEEGKKKMKIAECSREPNEFSRNPPRPSRQDVVTSGVNIRS